MEWERKEKTDKLDNGGNNTKLVQETPKRRRDTKRLNNQE
jgi:hypothetical protein